MTRIADVGYGALFQRRSEAVFVHDYHGELLRDAALAGSDLEVLRKGWVSITPIRLAHTAEITDEQRQRLESRDR